MTDEPAAETPPVAAKVARAMYLEGWDRDGWGDDLPAARATAGRLVDEIGLAGDG